MIKSKYPLFLASKSPRRRKMLDLMGIKYQVLEIEVEEIINPLKSPINNVKDLAELKSAEALKKIKNGIVLAADTIVVLNGEIIGKPNNQKDAKKILKALSGNSHYVYTGFALINKSTKNKIVDYSKTKVTFRTINNKEIDDYISTGSPLDKAGAYGIQDDYGAVFVKSISGCYYNVLGFPVSKIYESLLQIV